MADIRRLRSEHASLAGLAKDIGGLIDPERPNIAAISALRWRLCRELLAHLTSEDNILYPALFASPDIETARTARSFAEEMGDLARNFTLYMEGWTGERMAERWQEFCEETDAMLAVLGERIGKENAVLYPLAERTTVPKTPNAA